ncbi:hypothetical protein HID58_054410 [Brassica napus]|uniref:Uncharacterized protein n=1 Tax=Brassica napus TaxID=3708 RepID=A0ABQ8AIP3_BRANA|nr:hypothetical protein HID58_054410 [Brassica napus]
MVRDNRARPEGDVTSRYWAMKTKKGRWFRLREIEIKNRKRRARWRRTEALNRRSILSKRKRRPDFLTPPTSSLFHWSIRRRIFANRKVAASNRERIVPVLARYGLQLLDEMDRF